MWDAKKPMVTTSTQWWEIGIFTMTEEGLDRPDLMFHYGSVPFDMNLVRRGYPTTENAFCLTPNVTHARSLGTVRLRTPRLPRQAEGRPALLHRPARRARDAPRGEAGARDRLAVGDGRLARRRARAGAGCAVATTSCSTTSTRRTTPSTTPPARSAWARADDPDAPLDPRLRVKGVRGLRVCDGSIMPILVAPNPVITTTMIGEKCADMVKEDAGKLAEAAAS